MEKARAAANEQMQALEKQLARSDPDVAELKVLFASWQETYQKMMDVLERIAQTDKNQASRLREGVQAVLEQLVQYERSV